MSKETAFSNTNVFQMYLAHGSPGFWVRRTTWGATCARIVKVGALNAPGPYFGNPSVLMDVYTLSGELKQGAVPMPVPGTYKTWRQIEPPAWTSAIALRPLNDPTLDSALAILDRKRQKNKSTLRVEKVWLKVPFDRKDEAKKIGAYWSPPDRAWWIPAGNDDAMNKARKLGFT